MESSSQTTSATIGIIGTGELARALTSRLTISGLHVTIGSRNPAKRQWVLKDLNSEKVKLTTIDDCVKTCDVIFVAMHPQHHASISCHDDMLRGKILVDVSNTLKNDSQSNAEKLAAMFPSSHVVKAFNTISAYNLNHDVENTALIPICGDSAMAKNIVIQLVARLGFMPVNSGGLENATSLEKRNRELFPGWGRPTIVMFLMLFMWIGLALLRYYHLKDPPYTWERFPTNTINKIMACMSITCLAFVYLPGSFAGLTQLCWGTKQRRFSAFLDGWLKMRKQLGLYALFYGVIHMVMSTVLLSPAYYSKWYISTSTTIPANATEDIQASASSRMNWVGETCVFLGVMAIALMSLLGVTSLPSIARAMNWREWRCIQSYVGFACLLLAVSHTTLKGASYWYKDATLSYMMTVTFWSLPIPWLTLGLRILLFLPCFHLRLQKIRRGDADSTAVTSSTDAAEPVRVKRSQGHTNLTFEADGHLPIGSL